MECSLQVGVCRVNVCLEGLAAYQCFVSHAVSAALPSSNLVISQRMKSASTSTTRTSAGILSASFFKFF